MKMFDVGEKAFLFDLLPKLKKSVSFINDFGNDASVIDIGLPDLAVAFKIDRAAKPLAAYKGWTNFETWGRLAVTANCADLLAIGGTPKAFMLSVSVPGYWETQDSEAIIFGAAKECDRYSIAFLGGDMKESNEPHVVGAAIGLVEKNRITSRRSANCGDVIVLAGQLGGFAGAYLLLNNHLEDKNGIFKECVSKPRCFIDEALYLRNSGIITSAVDLSDGLLEGLQLLVNEGLGVDVNLDCLPLHQCAHQAASILNADLMNFAFTVGDWGILFTMPESDAERAINEAPNGMHLSLIGNVTSRKEICFYSAERQKQFQLDFHLKNEHFVQKMESEVDYFEHIVSKSFLREE